jgi:hypothetical protein
MTRKRVTRLALLGGLATVGTVGVLGLTQAHAAPVKQGVPSVAPTPVATQPIGATKPTDSIATVAPTPVATPVAGAYQDSKGVWHVPGGKTTDEASVNTVAPTPDTGSH